MVPTDDKTPLIHDKNPGFKEPGQLSSSRVSPFEEPVVPCTPEAIALPSPAGACVPPGKSICLEQRAPRNEKPYLEPVVVYKSPSSPGT